jgi:hypothetical protein
MIDLILLSNIKHFSDDVRVIRPTLATDRHCRSAKGYSLPTVTFDYGALRAPPVDLAELHVLNLVVRFDTLDDLRHLSPSLSPRTGITKNRI